MPVKALFSAADTASPPSDNYSKSLDILRVVSVPVWLLLTMERHAELPQCECTWNQTKHSTDLCQVVVDPDILRAKDTAEIMAICLSLLLLQDSSLSLPMPTTMLPNNQALFSLTAPVAS